MLGGLNPHHKQVAVIGGGIAGMLAAYRLGTCGYEVTLHEKGPWLGGLINTTHYPYGMVEQAAHSLRASKAVQQLCAEIGVELTPLRGSKAAYVLRGGKFHRFPLYPGELLQMFARAAFTSVDTHPQTLEAFGLRHLGRPALHYLLTPLVFGIYGARPAELQVPDAFPHLRVGKIRNLALDFIRQKLIQGKMSPMCAPKNGMGNLVKKLETALQAMPNVILHTQSDILFLDPTPNRIIATPAPAAAKLLAEEDTNTAALLAQISYSPLITATVFIERESMRNFPGGIGVLIPETEKIPILGVLFNSSSFEGRVNDPGLESLTVLCGGTPQPQLLEKSNEALETHIAGALDKLFGLKKPPLKIHLAKWKEAIPLYNAQLVMAHQRAQQGWAGLLGNVLAGNYTGQVSLRGMMEDNLNFPEYEG